MDTLYVLDTIRAVDTLMQSDTAFVLNPSSLEEYFFHILITIIGIIGAFLAGWRITKKQIENQWKVETHREKKRENEELKKNWQRIELIKSDLILFEKYIENMRGVLDINSIITSPLRVFEQKTIYEFLLPFIECQPLYRSVAGIYQSMAEINHIGKKLDVLMKKVAIIENTPEYIEYKKLLDNTLDPLKNLIRQLEIAIKNRKLVDFKGLDIFEPDIFSN
jgi:hypothetical protein